MADQYIGLPTDGSGKKMDTEETTVGANTVNRQRVILVPGAGPYGCTVKHVVAAGSNNAQNVKSTPGQVYGYRIFNAAGYPVYVKLYDKATAPAPASDTPKETIAVQAGVSNTLTVSFGVAYASGIGIAIVKGIADNDNTAVVANDCVMDLYYA